MKMLILLLFCIERAGTKTSEEEELAGACLFFGNVRFCCESSWQLLIEEVIVTCTQRRQIERDREAGVAESVGEPAVGPQTKKKGLPGVKWIVLRLARWDTGYKASVVDAGFAEVGEAGPDR